MLAHLEEISIFLDKPKTWVALYLRIKNIELKILLLMISY